nr:hypothetical protein [Burkholderia ubonensis]
MHRYFMYRCAELTREQGYTYFMVIPPPLSGAREPSSDLVKATGFDRSMMKKVATYTPIFIYGSGGGRQHFADSADIRMFNDDAVLSTKISAWDAAEVVDCLAPYVQSEGKTQVEMPTAWVFEPGRPKVRAQDLLPTAPSKTPASGI